MPDRTDARVSPSPSCRPARSAPAAVPAPSSDELFRLLMENVTDYAIFALDTSGNVTVWNSGAERILGYGEKEVLGTPAAIIYTPEDRAAGVPEREMRTARENGRADDERWHLRKDGARFWASGILTALKDEAGELRGFVKILRDFTERKRHEEELEAVNARMHRAVRETHHRVKNNLQVLSALVDLQALPDDAPVPGSELRRVGQHVATMAAIHEVLTEEARDRSVECVSAQATLEKIVPLLQRAVDHRPLSLDAADVEVTAKQATALALLVSELVGNAAKHGEGVIGVSLRAQGRTCELAVSDRGPGFPDGFSPTQSANTGLELVESLSRWDLGGAASYQNRPGGGAVVTVSFPLDLPGGAPA